MKRAASLLLAVIMLFCLCSCGNEYSKLTDDEIAAKVDSGELGTLYAHYSVQNGDSGDFYVQFDSSLKDYDYYSDKGTLVKFYGDTAVYDQDGNKVKRVDTIFISTQHDDTVEGVKLENDKIRKDLIEHVIKEVVPAEYLDEDTKYFINPSGRFVIGGPHGDSGLTGRKIIVDTYGGYARHGGGA